MASKHQLTEYRSKIQDEIIKEEMMHAMQLTPFIAKCTLYICIFLKLEAYECGNALRKIPRKGH